MINGTGDEGMPLSSGGLREVMCVSLGPTPRRVLYWMMVDQAMLWWSFTELVGCGSTKARGTFLWQSNE